MEVHWSENSTWVLRHELRDIVGPPVYYHPATLGVVVLCDLIAMELLALWLLLRAVIHFQVYWLSQMMKRESLTGNLQEK